MEDFNLHLTGDIHAVTAANNLLAAALERGYNLRPIGATTVGVSLDERSTLAEVEPVSSCVSDDECNAKIPGQVCGGGICYDASLPPRAAIGLDVLGSGLDSSLRVELRGDDTSTLRIDRTPIRYSVSLDDRKLDNEKIVPGVRDQLQITLSETYNSGDKDRTIALAGNLFIVGSIANIIVVDAAARRGIPISWRTHARIGIPVTLASLAASAAWLAWRAG